MENKAIFLLSILKVIDIADNGDEIAEKRVYSLPSLDEAVELAYKDYVKSMKKMYPNKEEREEEMACCENFREELRSERKYECEGDWQYTIVEIDEEQRTGEIKL